LNRKRDETPRKQDRKIKQQDETLKTTLHYATVGCFCIRLFVRQCKIKGMIQVLKIDEYHLFYFAEA
jgi:hypothetical protein